MRAQMGISSGSTIRRRPAPDELACCYVSFAKPWGVSMKKFNEDRPGIGLFDFATTTRELSVVKTSSRSVAASLAWEQPQATVMPRKGPYRLGGKRMLDILLVLASLPFTLPVIALCALALWIEGGRPFYTQPRVGRGGFAFSILKLRTMVRDADEVLEELLARDPEMRAEWDSLQKLKHDPRITPVGGFLRATSLDELPQLFNVLRGDMSLVGPRPMMVEQQRMYGNMSAYLAVRPGITGLWQVSARNGNTFAYRKEVDADYERDVTFAKDARIIAKTVGVVLRGTGY